MSNKAKTILEYICWFFIFLCPFNFTISTKIYFNGYIMVGVTGLAILLLFLLKVKKKLSKKQSLILLITLIVVIFELVNNYYIKQGRINNVILFNLYLFIPFILSFCNKEDEKKIFNVLKIFLLEHIIATFFIQICNSFYSNYMIDWLANGNFVTLRLLKNWNNAGYNAGLTTHYSTNGIYLAIAVMYFFTETMKVKSKKNILFTILSFVALMLTGKRAQALFCIIACIFAFLYNQREKRLKKIVNFSALIFSAILLIYILSMFVPQVLNVVNRFEESMNSESSVLTGREVLYDVAIENWFSHLMLGNGWGFFSEYYENYIYNPNSIYFNMKYIDAHNVYLQLLCEVGIIGFIFFVSIFIYFFIKSLSNERKYSEADKNKFTLFIIAYQVFFVLYCFSGNPLYDIQCYSLYFILIGCIVMDSKYLRLREKE